MKSINCEEVEYKREVKSFVLRSRMTAGQQLSLEKFWAEYGVDVLKGKLDYRQLFNNPAPVLLEIGFGMGNSLVSMAEQHPEFNFLGIEVHKPGVGAILSAIAERKLTNIRIMNTDAVQVLKNNIPSQSLFAVLLFFPDPWPKRCHHKRRIVQSEFVRLIHEKLAMGGYFHLATDVQDYAVHMRKVVASQLGFAIINEQGLSIELERPRTKFEQRGVRLGHSISDLIFVKKG